VKLIVTISLTLAVLIGRPCFAQDSNASLAPTQSPGRETPTDLQSFLQKLQEAVDATIATKEGERFAAQWEGMRIPDYETWFATTFGPENGPRLAKIYPDEFKKSEDSLLQFFILHAEPGGQVTASTMPDQKRSEFQEKFEEVIRQSLKTRTQFFRVDYKWVSKKDGAPGYRPLGYVTFIDGAYRILNDGVLRALPGMTAMRIRLGGNVAAAKLINRVPPVYPLEARQSHVSGTVRLHVILAQDGSIKSLDVVSGDALLVPAAVDAVKQWRYQPTLLNGEPVEVDTTIDVIFSLSR
jgi:TonB family protein